MMTEYDKKVSILSRINKTVHDMPKLSGVADRIALGLNLASLIDYGIVTETNDKITAHIEATFGYILSLYGLEDTGFVYAWEIDKNIPLPFPYNSLGDDIEQDD